MSSVRPAKISDHAFIVQAQIAMAYETEGGLQLSLPTVKLGVQAVLNDPTKGEYYMAVDAEDRPLACLLTIPEWSDWRNGTVLWIHSLYVVPEARKLGAFKILYHHLQRMVDDSPTLRGLRLYVDKRNENAQHAYQRVGMSNEHYEMYEWLKS